MSSTSYIKVPLYKNKYLKTQIGIDEISKRDLLKEILSPINLLSEIYELRSSVIVDSSSQSLYFQEKLIKSVLSKNGFEYVKFDDQSIHIPSQNLSKTPFLSKNVTLPPVLFMQQLPKYAEAFFEKDPKIKQKLLKELKTNISEEEFQFYKEKYKEEKRIKQQELKARKLEIFHLDIKNKKTQEIEDIYNNKTILSFDIEAYEKDNSLILEIGFSKFKKGQHIETEHFIIEEYKNLFNGKFVEDNKNNFSFGKSKILPLKEAIDILIKEIENTDNIIVGIGIRNDFKFIGNNELAQKVNHQKRLIDCGNFSRLYQPENTMGVKSFLNHFNIDYKYLHNAGNDAYYTAVIFNEIHHSLQLKKQLESRLQINQNNIENKENNPKSIKIKKNSI